MTTPSRKPRPERLETIAEDSASGWNRIANQRVRVPQHVVHRQFASETVLLNVQTGHYYGMDAIGARFFSVLRENATVEMAVSVLAAEFEGSLENIREDMVKYCEELVSKGLIELTARGD